MNLFDYRGIIHLHSSFSYDGNTSMERIVSAAQKIGIDFLMLTDHDHLQARNEGWEGWKGKTLVIVGEEIAPRFCHYLAFKIDKPVSYGADHEGREPQKYIDTVNELGGFGFIAHPDHEGTEMFHVKHYPWTDWNVNGYAGIGIWDFMTDWQKSLNGYFTAFLSFLFPAYFLKGPRAITLERWDGLNQIRKTVGIGELDNHASTKRVFGMTFVAFPFNRALKFIATHILAREPFNGDRQHDTDQVYHSLLNGTCYFSLDYFRKPNGFQFLIEQEKQKFFMGDRLRFSHNAQLTVLCPMPALIRIIKNGRQLCKSTGVHLSLPIEEPGVYRTEAYLKYRGKYRPWIFSNPIFVT